MFDAKPLPPPAIPWTRSRERALSCVPGAGTRTGSRQSAFRALQRRESPVVAASGRTSGCGRWRRFRPRLAGGGVERCGGVGEATARHPGPGQALEGLLGAGLRGSPVAIRSITELDRSRLDRSRGDAARRHPAPLLSAVHRGDSTLRRIPTTHQTGQHHARTRQPIVDFVLLTTGTPSREVDDEQFGVPCIIEVEHHSGS